MQIKFFCYFLLLLFAIPQTVVAVDATVVISEILYNPDGVDTGKEYIRLTNFGGESVDITGWDLDPSSAPYVTLPYFILGAGSSVTIHINTDGNNTDSDIFTGPLSNMGNTKGPVALFASSKHTVENLIGYVSYGEGGQVNEAKAVAKGLWTEGDFIPLAEEGFALVYDGVGNSSTDWSAVVPAFFSKKSSEELLGVPEKNVQESQTATEDKPPTSTPVFQYLAPPLATGDILINEFVSDGDEWIELFNTTDRLFDITGFTLEDGVGRATTLNGSIKPYDFFILESPSGKLNNRGDLLILKDKSGKLLDSITYGNWDDGDISDNAPVAVEFESVARRDGDFVVTTTPTKGGKNLFTSPAQRTTSNKAFIPTEPYSNSEGALEPGRIPAKVEIIFDLPERVLLGEPVRFDASRSYLPDDSSHSFIWDFGNGDGLGGIITEYVFHTTGTFSIVLTVAGEDSVTTLSKTLTVVDDPLTLPPTLFTLEKGYTVFISEFLPNPSGSDLDGEWVELQNVSSFDVDLSYWMLDDSEKGSKPYSFPKNTVVPAEDFLVIERKQSKLALNNTNDSVRLISPSDLIVQNIPYEGVSVDASYSFDGTHWQWTAETTRGEENTFFNTQKTTQYSETSNITLSDLTFLANDTYVSVRAVVLVPPELFALSYMYVVSEESDENNIVRGIKIVLPKDFSNTLTRGDTLMLSGVYKNSGDEPRIKVVQEEDITPIGTAEIPEATLVSSEFITDELLGSYITVSGEVADKKGNNIYLDDGVEEVRVYTYPLTTISPSLFSKESMYEISGILSKTRSGFRLLPIDGSDVREILVHSAHTETSQDFLPPVETTSSRKTLLQFLLVTVMGLIIFIVGLSLKIRRQKSEIASVRTLD